VVSHSAAVHGLTQIAAQLLIGGLKEVEGGRSAAVVALKEVAVCAVQASVFTALHDHALVRRQAIAARDFYVRNLLPTAHFLSHTTFDVGTLSD